MDFDYESDCISASLLRGAIRRNISELARGKQEWTGGGSPFNLYPRQLLSRQKRTCAECSLNCFIIRTEREMDLFPNSANVRSNRPNPTLQVQSECVDNKKKTNRRTLNQINQGRSDQVEEKETRSGEIDHVCVLADAARSNFATFSINDFCC